MTNEITAIVINFFRHEHMMACVASLREQYPDINIIVGNNDEPNEKVEAYCREKGAEFVQLPFDSGVSAGRNALVERVKTPYILVGDDDFYYTSNAKVDRMLELLKKYNVDLVGGRVFENGVLRDYQAFIDEHPGHYIWRRLQLNGEELQRCDLTFNFFVARTEAARDTQWDENVKVAYEHSMFFLDFKHKGYTVGFTPEAVVDHKRPVEMLPGHQQRYGKYRMFRTRRNDKKYFYNKYGLQYTIDMNGNKDVYDGTGAGDGVDFCITTFDRPQCLENLLFSIVEYYPSAHITIADQGKRFVLEYYQDLWKRLMDAGLKHKPTAYNVPYDCGLSYARNFLVDNTSRPYMLLLEEDFVFNEKTKIEAMLEVMHGNPTAGIVGGLVLENGQEVHFEHDLVIQGTTLHHKTLTSKWGNVRGARYRQTGSVLNFALFKRDMFNSMRWDNDLKIEGEHTDFYLRMRDVRFDVLYTDSVSITHDKVTEATTEYKDFRQRKEFLAAMMRKHNIDRIVYLDGFTIALGAGDNEIIYSRDYANTRDD